MHRYAFATLAIIVCTGWSASHADNFVSTKSNELRQFGAQVQVIQQKYANPLANTRFYTMQRRIVDAQVQFELQDYERASILFTDVLRFRGIERSREYVPILLQLARCHYQMKNYNSAREALNLAYRNSVGPPQLQALYYLVEIALETRNRKDLNRLFSTLSSMSPGSMRADILYVYGKALYELDMLGKADGAFTSIRPNTPYFIKARYFRAAILIRQKQVKAALRIFAEIAAMKVTRKDDRKVVELAHLSLGRIYYELGQFSKSLNHYQEIGRNSPQFEAALYEISWVFIKQKRYKRAMSALDILLLVSDDNDQAIEANILKGRLNIMLADYSTAVDTFKELIKRFEPIRAELAALRRDKKKLALYFRWLLRKGNDKFGLDKVLSDKAAKWVESNEHMLKIIGLFARMAKDRKDVIETMRAIQVIERVLAQPNRVEIFPALKRGYDQILELQNRLILFNKALIDHEASAVQNTVSPQEKELLARYTSERHALERKLLSIPLTVKALTQRSLSMRTKYDELKREAKRAETRLAIIRTQLLATEQYLADLRTQRSKKTISAQRAEQFRTRLQVEKQALRQLFNQILALKDSIDAEVRKVGTGDYVVRGESQLKLAVIRAQKREEELLNRFKSKWPANSRADLLTVRRLRGTAWGYMTILNNVIVRIEQKIDDKVSYFRKILTAERRNLGRYMRVVSTYERDSQSLSGKIGSSQFDLVFNKLSSIILEADLGIIDVAWKKKKQESEKIRKLQQDQRKMLTNLRKNFQSLLKGKD